MWVTHGHSCLLVIVNNPGVNMCLDVCQQGGVWDDWSDVQSDCNYHPREVLWKSSSVQCRVVDLISFYWFSHNFFNICLLFYKAIISLCPRRAFFPSASPFHYCFWRTFRVLLPPPSPHSSSLLPLLYFHGCTTEFLTYQTQQTASSNRASDIKTETGKAKRKREVETRISTTEVQSIFGFCCFLCFPSL